MINAFSANRCDEDHALIHGCFSPPLLQWKQRELQKERWAMKAKASIPLIALSIALSVFLTRLCVEAESLSGSQLAQRDKGETVTATAANSMIHAATIASLETPPVVAQYGPGTSIGGSPAVRQAQEQMQRVMQERQEWMGSKTRQELHAVGSAGSFTN